MKAKSLSSMKIDESLKFYIVDSYSYIFINLQVTNDVLLFRYLKKLDIFQVNFTTAMKECCKYGYVTFSSEDLEESQKLLEAMGTSGNVRVFHFDNLIHPCQLC
jgi:hypothetical protein